MERIIAATILALACSVSASAQTTINTSFVTVDNGDPQRVLLHFSTGPDQNIMLVVMTCSTGSVNHNRVFVYEFAPNGQINGYETATTVTCDIHFSDPNHTDDVFTATLTDPITITNVPDHPSITIETSTHWMANLKAGPRGGLYWNAVQSESQGQIEVSSTAARVRYLCGSDAHDCLKPKYWITETMMTIERGR